MRVLALSLAFLCLIITTINCQYVLHFHGDLTSLSFIGLRVYPLTSKSVKCLHANYDKLAKYLPHTYLFGFKAIFTILNSIFKFLLKNALLELFVHLLTVDVTLLIIVLSFAWTTMSFDLNLYFGVLLNEATPLIDLLKSFSHANLTQLDF